MTFVTVALLNSAFLRDHDDYSPDERSHGSADTVITGAVVTFLAGFVRGTGLTPSRKLKQSEYFEEH